MAELRGRTPPPSLSRVRPQGSFFTPRVNCWFQRATTPHAGLKSAACLALLPAPVLCFPVTLRSAILSRPSLVRHFLILSPLVFRLGGARNILLSPHEPVTEGEVSVLSLFTAMLHICLRCHSKPRRHSLDKLRIS